jgi:SAM-dependent methyltransferase
MMSVISPDYDSDPGRWQSWESPQDVHEMIAPDLRGPVLDVGCGEGRLASLLGTDVRWIGVDASPTQLTANPYRPVVRADMRALPFRDGAFAEVTQLWCLYHLADPVVAIAEAARVLAPGGRYFACCAARTNNPEIMQDGYPPSSFDAEEAAEIVAAVFKEVEVERWDGMFPVADPRGRSSLLPPQLHSGRAGRARRPAVVADQEGRPHTCSEATDDLIQHHPR